jgi:hypothetical protein
VITSAPLADVPYRTSRHALAPGRREQRTRPPTVAVPEQGCSLHAHRVHHGREVFGLLLQRRLAADGNGQPRPAAVEADHAREAAEPLEIPAHAQVLPGDVEMRGRPADEHEGDRSLAVNLVGDLHVARACEPGVGGWSPSSRSGRR